MSPSTYSYIFLTKSCAIKGECHASCNKKRNWKLLWSIKRGHRLIENPSNLLRWAQVWNRQTKPNNKDKILFCEISPMERPGCHLNGQTPSRKVLLNTIHLYRHSLGFIPHWRTNLFIFLTWLTVYKDGNG